MSADRFDASNKLPTSVDWRDRFDVNWITTVKVNLLYSILNSADGSRTKERAAAAGLSL